MNLLEILGNTAGDLVTGSAQGLIGGAINQHYQKEAEERAYKRQMELYNRMYKDNSPENRRKQLEDAGLSVGLMYGGATGAGGGSASGASAGASAASTNIPMPRTSMLEMQLGQKQLELTDAQINKTNAEAENLRGLERDKGKSLIDNIIADTANKEAQNSLLKLQADYQAINNNWANIKNEADVSNMIATINRTNEDTKRLVLSNEITDKSKPELIKNAMLQNANIISNMNVNKAEVEKIKAEIVNLGTLTDLNELKSINQSLMNSIDSVEARQTTATGMKEQKGLLGPVINGLRAGITSVSEMINLLQK